MSSKGKQGTRGQKTILTENAETLTFYKYVTVGVMMASVLMNYFVFSKSMEGSLFWAMHILVAIIYLASYKFMSFMGSPKCSPDGTIIDCGTDLNMDSGMAEHCKDIILLTAGTQILALISDYLWLLLLLAPIYGFYLFWVNIAAPWIFAEPPVVDEKKSRREERQERRQTKFRRA